MASAGFDRLKEPKLRDARVVRAWTAGVAVLTAVGLALVAGRPPAEQASFEIYNLATQRLPTETQSLKPPIQTSAPVFALRPAFGPKDRSIPTTRGRSRKAGLTAPPKF